MDLLCNRIDKSIECSCKDNKCKYHNKCIDIADISNGIKSLKPGKKDGSLNLFSNHILHGTHRFHVLISL